MHRRLNLYSMCSVVIVTSVLVDFYLYWTYAQCNQQRQKQSTLMKQLFAEQDVNPIAPQTTAATTINNINTILQQAQIFICLIAAERRNASYVQRVTEALIQQSTQLPGALVDLDDHYADVQLPVNFFRLTPQDRKKAVCDDNEKDTGLPNCVTRQQARDFTLGLTRCSEFVTNSTWVLLMEDDMLPCPGSMATIQAQIKELVPENIHLARFGRLPGVVGFPPPRSALPYTKAVMKNIDKVPCDLVLDHDWRGGTNSGHNAGSLFEHIGSVSTNAYRNAEWYVQLYASMRTETCGAAY